MGAPMATCSVCGERDGGIGHGKTHSRTGLARVGGDVGSVADVRRQAGSGRARSRARARLNWVSQGQRCVRCRVRRRAERVIRPARAKKRRLRVQGGPGRGIAPCSILTCSESGAAHKPARPRHWPIMTPMDQPPPSGPTSAGAAQAPCHSPPATPQDGRSAHGP